MHTYSNGILALAAIALLSGMLQPASASTPNAATPHAYKVMRMNTPVFKATPTPQPVARPKPTNNHKKG